MKKYYLKILEWCPPGRRRRIKGRPRNSWMQEGTIGMREKGINKHEMDRQGRMEKENKTLSTERCVNVNILYINKKIYYYYHYYYYYYYYYIKFSKPTFVND